MRVALYARVSTEDKGQDPETQLLIIRELAQRRGYEVVAEYIDYASGKDANRPKFKEMIARASERYFDAIVALRLDRIMRSIVHLEALIQQLTVYGVSLVFSDMDFDPSSPNSRLTINLISAIAQWEREIISARTREGLQSRKVRGQKLGKKKRDDVPLLDIARDRINGLGWKTIAAKHNIPKTTLLDRRVEIESAVRSLGGSDNVPRVAAGSDKGGVV